MPKGKQVFMPRRHDNEGLNRRINVEMRPGLVALLKKRYFASTLDVTAFSTHE